MAPRCWLLSALALLALVATTHSYNVNATSLRVVGFSAGGFMAVQLHVAFSSSFGAAAIFAGGPYYCAQGTETNALEMCMSMPTLINVNTLVKDTTNFASQGLIDPVSNLNDDRVYLYSGTKDTVVRQGVVKALQQYYEAVASGINFTTDYSTPSQHCLPTNSYGNACSYLGSPYINNCNYDGAGVALNVLYDGLKPPVAQITSNIIQIQQTNFIPKGASSLGIAPLAFAYIPTACTAGAECELTIALHGCLESYQVIGTDFYESGGFNGWAEANNIIVLYPQATTNIGNPNGCWDWWGYTGKKTYYTQSASQMQTFMNMVQWLMGSTESQ